MTTGDFQKLNTYVQYTVRSGVQPIELLFQPVLDCYSADSVAYRVVVRVNSLTTGVLNPDDYLSASVDEETLHSFTDRAIKKTAAAQLALQTSNVRFSRLFVRCPSSFVYAADLYTRLKLALGSGGVRESKLSLEFDGSVMDADKLTLQRAFADIRAAGCTVAVNGYGGLRFSMEKLLAICPDQLFLDESIAALTTDKEKRAAVAPLINFAKSLGGELIACGVSDDEHLREFRSRDCIGFLPDGSYHGALTVDGGLHTLVALCKEGTENV